MDASMRRPVALTIAGSDSGGGAGVQMDLRVFQRLGCFGTSVLSAVTAQNLGGVRAVGILDPSLVRDQLAAVLEGFEVRAIKTGMLGSRALVACVAEALGAQGPPLVVDPVMVATSGARLLEPDAVEAYREVLLPLAALATPNLDEAAVLLGIEAVDRLGLLEAAEALFEGLGCPVLLKGGHLPGDPVDVLRHRGGQVAWRHRRVEGVDTHGSGCMLSAAVAAHLALGEDRVGDLVGACAHGLAFAHDALARGVRLSTGVRLADVEAAEARLEALERLE